MFTLRDVIGQLPREQFDLIKHPLPVQRSNVKLDDLQALNGLLFVAVSGCAWRALPKRYGRWHTVYRRMNRWAKAGVLDRAFEELQVLNVLRVKTEGLPLDSTSVKAHPDGAGALKKGAPKPSAGAVKASAPRFIWLPRVSSRPPASH